MNTRYCAAAGCGKANPYTAIKPTFCSFCGKSFSAAFSTASLPPNVPVSTASFPSQPYQPTGPAPRIYLNAKGEDISHLYQRPTAGQHMPITDSDDYYDRDVAAQEAAYLADTIRASVRVGIDESAKPVRLGDLANIQQAIADARQADGSKVKKSRARK